MNKRIFLIIAILSLNTLAMIPISKNNFLILTSGTLLSFTNNANAESAIDFYKNGNKKRKKRFSQIINLFRDDGSTIDIPQFDHPGVQLEKKEDAKLLFEAIESLNDEQKTAYILKNIQGLKYKKISKVMKKSSSSIESLIFRAKKNLKKYLEKKLNDKK